MSFDVRYLKDEEIKAEADALLASYSRARGKPVSIPVLLDDIADYLGLRLDFDDLRTRFNLPDVLAAIWIEEKQIYIDQTLDPSMRPAKLARFNFSFAHEIGHWQLHRGYVSLRRAIDNHFGGRTPPSIICRTSQQRERVEVQADLFASYLLMPRAEVIRSWQRVIGPERIRLSNLPQRMKELNATTVCRDPTSMSQREQNSSLIETIIRPLAKEFEVSPQAMRIRLEKLGWIARDVDETESLSGAA